MRFRARQITEEDVLYEDNHLLVLDKPAGVATMGAAAEETTAAKLAATYLKQKYSKPGNVFIGVVSRLDSRVSGVLILARTSKGASRLSEQIRTRKVQKEYLAWVENAAEPSEAWRTATHWLCKNDSKHRMEVVRKSSSAQQAELRWRCLAQHKNSSLLAIELITGRKHQIRVQLAELGMPIVGDAKYGAERKMVASRFSFGEAIALHCRRQAVKHPTRDAELEFISDPERHWPQLPEHWKELVK